MRNGSRAVLFVAGAGLAAVWLAAAADRQPAPRISSAERRDASLERAEHLADEIQAQASRLRTRLAAAPQPTVSARNPFTLSARRDAERRLSAASVEPALEGAFAAAAPEPPPIALSGIAEEAGAAENSSAPVRIAVIEGYGDVFLVKVGETIASRYQVTAIGADTAEVKDLLNGRTIRLGLR